MSTRPISFLTFVLVGECLQQFKGNQKPHESVGTATSVVAMTTPERDDPNVSTNEAPGDESHVDITSPDLPVQEKIAILEERFEELIMKAVSYFAIQEAKDPGFLSFFRRRVTFLSGLQQLLPSTFSKENILEAKSVDWLLAKFSEFWDYMNCNLLERIVSNFGDSTLKKEMTAYMIDLKVFCSMTNVLDFPAWEDNIPPDFSKVVAKLIINADECTVAHLLEYRQRISESSVIQPADICLNGAGSGSVIVTLSLPRVLTSLFVKTFDKQTFVDELTIDGIPLEEYQHLLKVFLILLSLCHPILYICSCMLTFLLFQS